MKDEHVVTPVTHVAVLHCYIKRYKSQFREIRGGREFKGVCALFSFKTKTKKYNFIVMVTIEPLAVSVDSL